MRRGYREPPPTLMRYDGEPSVGISITNVSGANVYFANDGFELYFFTFNPSRKAQQIGINPRVHCVVRPDGEFDYTLKEGYVKYT